MLPILVNEQDIESTVIKKANQFTSFKFDDIQILDIMNFLGGATSLDTLLKAYKTSETKEIFPYEWFDHPDKLQNTKLPPYDAFYSKLRSSNHIEANLHELCYSIGKWIDHRKSRRQIKTIKITSYWNLELSIPATDM